MRTLFTCIPEFGHFLPLAPLARALAHAGHEVAFAAPVWFRGIVEAAGFQWIRAGIEDDVPEMAALLARGRELRGPERGRFINGRIFGGIRPRRLLPDLLAVAEAWRPDLLVRDAAEFAAMVASELLDIPHAKVEIHATGARPHVTAMLEEPLQHLRAEFGLPRRPIAELMEQYLVLTPFPASLNAAGVPIAPTTHRVRPLLAHGDDATLPGWVQELELRPLIYVSLGTVFSGPRGLEVFSRLLAGLRDVPAQIVLTVGHELDPAALGPQPANVHVERFLPLGALLPRCSLVVFHGGSGTLGQVLAHGLPMAILPLGADQPENAARCAELGVARTLDQEHIAPDHVREVILDVLQTPSYRQSAERLRDEIDGLPGVEFAVELLERLARDRAPLLATP